jgi:hypothetical protein
MKAVYVLLLLIGALGFLAMTFLGLAHGVGMGHSVLNGHVPSSGHVPAFGHSHLSALGHGHSPAVHQDGGAAAMPHAPAHHQAGTHAHQDGGTGAHPSVAWKLLMAISPLDIFSLALGFGATGLLLGSLIAANQLVWCAIGGALVFDFVIVKPLMGLMLRFASRPSEGLEGEVSSIGQATTAFDHNGKGLVSLSLDGQFTQLLASLDPSEQQLGVTVSKGDKVVVIEVDSARNTCTVSRELAPSLADDAAASKSQAQRRRSP